MYKLFIFSFLVILLFNNGFSQIISENLAKDAAIKFLKSKDFVNRTTPCNLSIVTLKNTSKSNPEIFIFNKEDGGFVIVSGDKSANPIIGYSKIGVIPESDWAPNFNNWIDNYINQIKFIRNTRISSTQAISDQWCYLLNDSYLNNPYNKNSKASAGPLLRSYWGQTGYYNAKCPIKDNKRAMVGCVATAMSQIMYYYRYPQSGNGSSSYYHSTYGSLSANYANANYNYNEMSASVNYPSDAVATLCYHAGVSVKMNYSHDGSGAFSQEVDGSLKTYFKYESAEYYSRFYYTDGTWINMLTEDLDAKHPIYYSGSSENDGGHAFIIDGYDSENKFHLDWGWEKMLNGYFDINSLNPGTYSFVNNHACVAKIYPPSNAYSAGCANTKTLTHIAGSIEDGSGPLYNYKANADCSWLIDPTEFCSDYTIAFKEIDLAEKDTIYIYKGADASAPLYGKYSGQTLPSILKIVSNKVFINFKSDATNQRQGFLLDYFGSNNPSCNGITRIYDASKTFDDGSGEGNYGNNSFCRWIIKPADAVSFSLNFTKMDLTDDGDSLTVIDGNFEKIKVFKKEDTPQTFNVNTNQISLTFKTNDISTGKGFELSYTSSTTIGLENNQSEANSINIYPNPAKDILNIEFGDSNNEKNIMILGVSGRCVYSEKTNNAKIIISTNKLAPGIYTVASISDKGNTWKKIIIE